MQKLKNIDWKTLVIFQLPRSPREKHACFIPTREHSIGRHLNGFTQSQDSLPGVIVPVFIEFTVAILSVFPLCKIAISLKFSSEHLNPQHPVNQILLPFIASLMKCFIYFPFQTLSGNFDAITPQYHFFEKPIEARLLKIIPEEWEQDFLCMRFDFKGCQFGMLFIIFLTGAPDIIFSPTLR